MPSGRRASLIPPPPTSSPNSHKLKNTPCPRCVFCSWHFFPVVCSRAAHGHSTTWTKLQFQQPVTQTIWAVCMTHTLAPGNPISHSSMVLQAPGEYEEPPAPTHGEESKGEMQSWGGTSPGVSEPCSLASRLSQDPEAAPRPWGLRTAPQLLVPRLLPHVRIHWITVGSN